MSRQVYSYRVETRRLPGDQWMFAIGSQDRSRSYAYGWVYGVMQFRPCPDQRIMRSLDCQEWELVEQFTGHGKVHLA